MASTTKTVPAGVVPTAGAAASAPGHAADRPVQPVAASPPGGPAAAVLAALVAGPGASAAQLAQAAGITRTAAARELATLEKAGRATRDRSLSPATWTAKDLSDDTPASASPHSPDLPPSPPTSPAGTATQDTEAPGTLDPGDENTGSATPANPAGIAPGADEALGAAAAVAARRRGALQAGDIAGALVAADDITQAAARARRLLREAGRVARRGPAAGTLPGELRGLVAAHLAAYPAEDFGPHAIGRVLGRSSGAVANALDRLTALGQAQLTNEAPRRYRNADPSAIAD